MLPSRDDPYDPDMTVAEALDLGLVAVMDSGRIGRSYHAPCDAYPPARDLLNHAICCTRVKGHKGPHAFVLRWEIDFMQIEKQDAERARLRELKEAEERLRVKMIDQQRKAQMELEAREREERKKKRSVAEKELDRLDSLMYGLDQRKNQRFRDQSVGKIRGKR